jgi:hypothetical protein
MNMQLWQVVLAFSLACSPSKALDADALPIVDLGYVKHRALSLDPDGEIFHFSNIRFARPPLGNLRFRKPVAPEYESIVQDGNYSESACVQTWPVGYVPGYPSLDNLTFGTEDCLVCSGMLSHSSGSFFQRSWILDSLKTSFWTYMSQRALSQPIVYRCLLGGMEGRSPLGAKAVSVAASETETPLIC